MENAVKVLLEHFGYRTIYLEEYPWATQVRLLRSADSIVGFHGAGLANIIFSEARQLLEFTNPLEARPYFAIIAREMAIDYNSLVGTLEGFSPKIRQHWNRPWLATQNAECDEKLKVSYPVVIRNMSEVGLGVVRRLQMLDGKVKQAEVLI